VKPFLLLLSCALSGCASPGKLDNLLVTTLSGDRAFISSLYGPVGVTTELRKEDARELLIMREKSRLFDILRANPSNGI
jgi:hypothetical protein